MAQNSQRIPLNPNHPQQATAFRWPIRRSRVPLRRRRLPVVRLGGGSNTTKAKKGVCLVRIMRRMRLRWLKLHCICMMKKFKEHCKNFTKDLKEASAALEMLQQRALMETSFAVPVVAVSFSSLPSVVLDRARSSMFM